MTNMDGDSVVDMLRRLCQDQMEMLRRQRNRFDAAVAALNHVGALVGKSDIPANQKEYILGRIQQELKPLSLGGPGETSPSPGPILPTTGIMS